MKKYVWAITRFKKIQEPVVPETGVFRDFYNNFGGLQALVEVAQDNAGIHKTDPEEEFWKLLDKSEGGVTITKYEEEYPPERYPDAVDDKNRERVVQLDALVEKLNTALQNRTLTTEQVREVADKASVLIFGDKKKG